MPVWRDVQNWDNLNTSAQVTRTWVRTVSEGNTYKYRLRVYDEQNELTVIYNNNLIEFPIVPPPVIIPPSIASLTHEDGVESANDDPSFIITNNHGTGTNQYCLDLYDTCIPDASST